MISATNRSRGGRASLAALFVLALAAPAAWAGVVPGLGTWETTLQARDLDGNPNTIEAYYDTSLNITWLQNANAGAGSQFDDGLFNDDGRMTWKSALFWADSLNIGGVSGWRLPSMVDTGLPGCPGAEFSLTGGTSCGQNVITTPGTPNASEMGHMYAVTLGNSPAFSTSGTLNPKPWLANTGPFTGIFELFNAVGNGRDDAYWTNQGVAGDASSAWKFLFGEGEQIGDSTSTEFFAWAVRDGDVLLPAVVPLPASAWLLLSGVLGLALVSRGRQGALPA